MVQFENFQPSGKVHPLCNKTIDFLKGSWAVVSAKFLRSATGCVMFLVPPPIRSFNFARSYRAPY